MNDHSSNRLRDHRLLGFRVNPGTIDDYIALVADTVDNARKETVFYHNLHSLYSYFRSGELRQCYDKATILADGMPIVWLLKLMRFSAERDQRVTYVDFIWPLLEAARDNNWSVYHVGQQSEVQQQALEEIRERLPGISIDGHDGYFDQSAESEDSLRVIAEINKQKTDVLLVGFGAPKQEFWIDAHREKIDAPMVFSCGACMEYVAGHVKTPPRWMGRLGLEWSYRLFENPRRFAFRYLVEPLLLGFYLLRNLLSERSISPIREQTTEEAKQRAGG